MMVGQVIEAGELARMRLIIQAAHRWKYERDKYNRLVLNSDYMPAARRLALAKPVGKALDLLSDALEGKAI